MKRILALIPARGGSKGVPRKNLRKLCQKPLIGYSIDVANESKLITDIAVTTDDDEIADVSREFGCNVPFKRPDFLASDTAKTIDVCLHALEFYQKNGIDFDILVLLQPTSPLRNVEDLDGTIEKLIRNSQSKSCITLSPVGACHPNYLYKRMKNDNVFTPMIEEQEQGERRQEFATFYYRNGAVYAVRVDFLLHSKKLMEEKSLGYIMPEERSVNIDCEYDFLLAEKLMEINKLKHRNE